MLNVLIGAKREYDSSCKVLLRAGANVNSTNAFGETPLHIAAIYDRHNVIELLLKEGADETIVNNHGETAFDCVKVNPLIKKQLEKLQTENDALKQQLAELKEKI